MWLTGLSGSGKSTVAVQLEQQLITAGRPAYLLDGDNLRQGLNGDLGFSAEDRDENVRRVGHVARLFCDAGIVAIVPLISPYRAARDFARALHQAADLPFFEVFIDTPLEICEQRDPKGLYKKARAGEITGMTGIDDPYEAPLQPELRFTPDDGHASSVAAAIIAALSRQLLTGRAHGVGAGHKTEPAIPRCNRLVIGHRRCCIGLFDHRLLA